MSSNETLVRQHFNRYAGNFDEWEITNDRKLLQSFFRFAGLGRNDTLLEVACGTGAFALYAADHVKAVRGVDVSDGMLEIARANASVLGKNNVEFICHGCENLPFSDSEFSVVTSKAAFHHMENHRRVFSEMVRCCQVGGTICLQDIIAYEDEYVNRYFEDLEIAIDGSHFRTLEKEEIYRMFKDAGIKIERMFQVESLLGVDHYIRHAVQDPTQKARLAAIVEQGQADPRLSKYFAEEDRRRCFKRGVYVVAGIKQF